MLAWQLSNTLDGLFCRVALRQALEQGVPTIFNSDQGAQFTADEFTSLLEGAGTRISMDGRGRALDNVFVERLWRTVKYEHIYLMDYAYVPDLETGLHSYFQFYIANARIRAWATGRRQRCTSHEPFLRCLVAFDIQSHRSYNMTGFTADVQSLPKPEGVHLILADPWSKEWGQPQTSLARRCR